MTFGHLYALLALTMYMSENILTSFNIPVEEFEGFGVNTEHLVSLLELINAPQDCDGFSEAVWAMQYAASSIHSLGVNLSSVSELVLLLETLCKHLKRSSKIENNADQNVMMHRYEEYPF